MTASKDGANSFTNISVEEHFSVSQSTSGGQFVGPTEEISTAADALIGRATGGKIERGDSVTSMANEAVARNKKIGKEDDKKIRLRDIVAEIDVRVTRDRSVTSEDAEAVVQAELNHSPYNHVIPGGVAESVAAAYKLNRSPSM
ncbi:BnaA03g12360D [Brassica napus]|uniref:BnaA03g12360D protein n=1 Tax=Brassica napus TaxID=3708 RepID=A0A078IAA6_BRANA|nr:BnaA03g12360D [Brassica napus]